MIKEISFVIPVSGIIRIDGTSVTIRMKRAETVIPLELVPTSSRRLSLEHGQTTYDIVLTAARQIVSRTGVNRFTAAEMYAVALERHPELKRNSFMARIISSTPDHPSFKHFASKRAYFGRPGAGLYQLNERYMAGEAGEDEYNDNSLVPQSEGSRRSADR